MKDDLRAHPEIASAYENEKWRARGLHPFDSHAYIGEKSAWVRDAEATALIWFSERQAVSKFKLRQGRMAANLARIDAPGVSDERRPREDRGATLME